jgi:hydrogenase maturation protein HypF
MTSGNISEEPIAKDSDEAVQRLSGIADYFLVHNRDIYARYDDSVTMVERGEAQVLRRARGYAPYPVHLDFNSKQVLACGAEEKNTFCLTRDNYAFVSQHIGDLETDQAFQAFQRVIADLERLYAAAPSVIAADTHPDYLSAKHAREICSGDSPESAAIGRPADPVNSPMPGRANSQPATRNPKLIGVQHHVAHALSCMAENDLAPPALGVSWDGTGYGSDGTVWGGEFFLISGAATERVAHVRPFPLPGGDQAVKEPRRTALGLLYAAFGDTAFQMNDLRPVQDFKRTELATLQRMLRRNLNSPQTSSVGRLFDAVAALTGLRQRTHFEGQAAMELEFALEEIDTEEAYPFPIAACRSPREERRPRSAIPNPQSALQLDWWPMVEALLADLRKNTPAGEISAKFHNALVAAIVAVARRCATERVVLSGGCFQNRYLTERTVEGLRAAGFRPYWHQRVPPNDGGIALGQIVAARRAAG